MIRKALVLLLVLAIALLPGTSGCSSGKSEAGFTFAIITDVHAYGDQAAAIGQLVNRLNQEAPDFVVNLGDLIFEGNTANVTTATEWYNVYQNAISKLDSSIPIYHAVGCHDVVGISCNVPTTDPGYGKGLFLSKGFGQDGRTYYSFDHEGYHCIVLDPNELVNGDQVYQIPDAQKQWLEEDADAAGDAPLLVFFSEPTVNWTSRVPITQALRGHEATFFSGHLHHDIMLTNTDFPEQVTAAACGEWWKGNNPDGRPPGYRLVSVKGDESKSLYKGTADQRTIDPGLETVVSGKIDLAVKMDSMSGAVSSASYSVDGGNTVSMDVKDGEPWAVATASWDTAALAEGYHDITFQARDDAGSFELKKTLKVSATKTISPSELNAHLKVYQGNYVSLEGTASLVYLGPLSISGFEIPDGMGFVYMTDNAEGVIVLPAEALSPNLSIVKSQFTNGDRVIIKVVPLRMSMAYVKSTQEWAAYFERIKSYVSYLPLTAREPQDVKYLDDLVGVWGARWVSANDLTFLSA